VISLLVEFLRKRGRRYLLYLGVAVPAAMCHNLLHEAVHYIGAIVFGEGVTAFRFLTNGWGTSQVVFSMPVEQRVGGHWLVVAWAPSIVTTLLGYGLYAARSVAGRHPVSRYAWLYAGFFFLLLDPFYMSLLSLAVGGDVEAAAAVGLPVWPVQAVAAAVLLFNVRLFTRWQKEVQEARVGTEEMQPGAHGGG